MNNSVFENYAIVLVILEFISLKLFTYILYIIYIITLKRALELILKMSEFINLLSSII